MHQSLLLPPTRVFATMSKLEKIIADLKLAESKKEALQQAFETLKSNSSSVASFTLQWSDLDAHFSSLRSSIQSRLEELQSQLQKIESNCTTLVNLFSHKQPNSICSQVSDVLRSSPRPPTLVLDTIPLLLKNCKGDFQESAVTDCVLLLEQLVQLVSIPSKVSNEEREKARRLAVEWKEKMRVEIVGEVMGFLNILGIYGLVEEFDIGDLLELFEVVSVQDRAPELCRVLELEEKMPEFIQKLIMKEKPIQAIKFIYEFGLVNLFPPVDLIKSHLRLTKRAIKKIRKKVKVFPEGQREAVNKELAALRDVLKCISKYKLEAKIELQHLHRWIGELETLKREEEAFAAAIDPTPSLAPSSPTTAPASVPASTPSVALASLPASGLAFASASAPASTSAFAPASASKAQPQQQIEKPTPSLAPSSPTTALASISKAQPQQQTKKPNSSLVLASLTNAPTSASKAQPQQHAPISAPTSGSKAQPQQQTGKPTTSSAPSPTTIPASTSKAQPQQLTGKSTPFSAPSFPTTALASTSKAQPQQQTRKATPSPAPSSPTTASASTSKAQPQQLTRKATPSLAPSSPRTTLASAIANAPFSAPAFATTSAPASAPASATVFVPTFAPAYAPSSAPTCTLVSTPSSVPTFAPAYASSSVPAFALASSPVFSHASTPTFASTNVPTSAPAYAPSTTPAFAPPSTPAFAPASVPPYVPVSPPAYAHASAPAHAPTSAYQAQPQPQQQTGNKRSGEELEAQSNQQSGSKRCQTAVLAGAAPQGQPHHLQQAGLSTGQAAPYLPAPPRYYASPGSAPINPQMSSSAGHHGSTNFNPANQYMMPPAQQYGSSIRPSWNTGQFSFTTTNPPVAANPGGVGQFNLAGRPAGMAGNAHPNRPAPHYSSNVPFGHGYRPPTYTGGYGLQPQQRPP